MAALDLGTAEADGGSLAACAGVTLSPMALGVEYDPWSTGTGVYGLLGGSLQIAGEADGSAGPSATPYYPVEGLQGEADGAATAQAAPFLLARLNVIAATGGASRTTGQLGGTLEIAGEADSAASSIAPMSGGGTPTPMQAEADSSSAPLATINARNLLGQAEGDGTAAAAAAMGTGTGRASAAGSASPAAALRLAEAMHAASGGASAPEAALAEAGIPIGTAKAQGNGAALATIILLAAMEGRASGETAIRTAKLADNSMPAGESDGSAAATANATVVASITGRSGPDGWEAPLVSGAAAGSSAARADLSRGGAVTVELAGTA